MIPNQPYKPFTNVAKSGNPEALALGKQFLAQGKVGAIVLAGGQGTRLGVAGPKGCYSISLVQKKSLFQLFAEKTVACGKMVGKELHIAFMTSPENHVETYSFFQKHHFFGLKENQVHFFQQSTLPLVDEQGSAVIFDDGQPMMAADGNGSLFWNFVQSGLFAKWQKAGIEQITTMVIDNPLSDPFDAEIIGMQVLQGNDVTIKAIEKTNPEESVGLIIEKNGHPLVIEYSEISKEEKAARNADGSLLYRIANITYFCFSLSFIKKIVALPITQFPLHLAKKMLPGHVKPVIKSEYFIFDILQEAKKVEVILSERKKYFAPLKNLEGNDSPKTVHQALLERDRELFEEISGIAPPQDRVFELSMDFYYPTDLLKHTWKNKPLPNAPYIQ